MAKGKYIEVQSTIEDALTGAAGIVTDLYDEMSSWRDSLEDKFSSTDKYSRVSDAADSLENADMESRCERVVDALKALADKPECKAWGIDEIWEANCSYKEFSGYKHTSRADRLGNATASARAGIEAIHSKVSEDRMKKLSDLSDAVDEVEEALAELEGIDFPGMFG